MTRPIFRNRRSGQCAIDRRQGPEYFRSAIDRYIRIGSLKHGQFSRLFARISHYRIGSDNMSTLIYLLHHRLHSFLRNKTIIG